MRRFIGGLALILLGLTLPATVPQTRGVLILLWAVIAMLGGILALSSPPVLARFARALSPYLPTANAVAADPYVDLLRDILARGQDLRLRVQLEDTDGVDEYVDWRLDAFHSIQEHRSEDV